MRTTTLKLFSLFFCAFLWLPQISASPANGNNDEDGLSIASSKTPTPLFRSQPSFQTPRKYGVSSLRGDLNTRGLSLGASALRIELPNGKTVDLDVKDIDRRNASDLAWFGEVSGHEDSDVSLTLKNGLVFGRIRDGYDVFEISSDLDGSLTVEQIDTGALPTCDTGGGHIVDGDGSVSAGTDTPAVEGDAGILIDLLVVYSADALANAGSVAQMEATAQAAVDAANAAFVNSNMTARYRLVHTASVNHATLGSTSDDLGWVTNSAEVAALRNEYGADMVTLLVDTPSSCGTAWVQRNPGPGFEDYAFAATDVDCAVGGLTFAHEHGHNMGFEHNFENSSVGSNPDSASYPWSFAHYVDGSYRTVMSYSAPCSNGCSRATYFSNPNIIYNGVPTGIDNDRDNARTGDLTAPIIQDFRAEVIPSSGSVTFAAIGDYGEDSAEQGQVANLINGWGVDFIIGAGDNRYGSISFDRAVGKYYCDFLTDVTAGSNCNGGNSTTNAFFPTPGNHDYTDGGGIAEFDNYFTLPGAGVQTSGGSGSERYYDVIVGPVHVFMVDSQKALGNSGAGAANMDAQQAWLQSAMSSSTAPWQVVLIHHAPYSSANHGSYPALQWPYASWGADAVIAGHDHVYERLEANGIPYFVNGLGGRSIYSFNTPLSNSQVRYNGDYGAMRITASDTEMTFEFINTSGSVIDSHTIGSSGNPNHNNIVNIRVAQSSDDAEELADTSPTASYATGHITTTSTDLELADDDSWHGGTQEIGLRFQNVDIPQGATITAAWLEFATDEAGSDPTMISIRAQASDNAATFNTAAYNISSRPETSASVSWSPGGWSTIGKLRTTPDLSAVVQEVVNRSGWQANNSMAFLITGSGRRTVESWDGSPATAPLLHVEWSTGTPPPVVVNLAYSENFDDGQAEDFSPQDTDWTVISGAYEVSTSEVPSISTIAYDEAGLSNVTIGAEVTGVGGSWQNGLIVFDYKSPTDFKYAGAFFGANKWRIGHYTTGGIVHDVEVTETLNLSTPYDVHVTLDGTVATLYADGEEKASFDFGDNLLDGEAGLGVQQAHSRFDNFSIQTVGSAVGIHEAEDAVLSGPVVFSSQSGYSGSGYADYQNLTDDYVEWTVNAATAGQYVLRFGYALLSGDRPLEISVNGQVVDIGLSFLATGGWTSWAVTGDVAVSLDAGINTIRATATGSSGANVDYLEIDNYTPSNQPPTANFISYNTDLTINFTDLSSDSDGTVVAWDWNFGDGNTSTDQNPSHTYAAAGTYNVSLTVTDNEGANDSTGSNVTVTVPDTVAPSISAPGNVTAEATAATTPVSLGTPIVSDDVDPNPTVTNDAPAAFPVGMSIVTWTATDASGNSASDTQTVTVTDTTAPSITAPADVSVESSEPVAVNLGTPSITDLADPNPVVSNDAPALFPLGTTLITWTATDTSGNSATATQTVTVSAPVPQPPAAPTNLTASVQQSGKGKNKVTTGITLNWTDNSDSETGFVVEGCKQVTSGKGKNRTVTCNYIEIGTVAADVTSFAVDLSNDHDHFRVKAVNNVGPSTWSNEVNL